MAMGDRDLTRLGMLKSPINSFLFVALSTRLLGHQWLLHHLDLLSILELLLNRTTSEPTPSAPI